jgi:ribose/xylose/arabinose/galactoside ABC-type transport system permease subunit
MKHADASPAVEIDVDVDAEDAAEIAAETEAATVNTADERLAYRGVFQRLLIRPEVGAIIGAAAIWVFFWAVADTFGVATGFANIMDVSAPLGIMAVAVSLLMIGGEFDLSSGAATGALGIVTILLVKDIGELGGAGLSLWIAIPLSLIVALGLGYFNGTMVERTGLPSFIVTLATFFILRGFKLGFSKLIIDNISVGRIDEASGRGYEFWKPIFDGVWARNDHQLGSRDAIWLLGFVVGGSLLGAAVYEMNFKRRSSANPIGLPLLLAGLAGAAGSILYMHNSDGRGANTLAVVLIAASALAAFLGLCIWRFEPQSPGSTLYSNETMTWTVAGVIVLNLGIIAAQALELESQQSVLDLVGALQWPLIILAAALAAFQIWQKQDASQSQQAMIRSVISTAAGAFAAGFSVYGFLFMTTEQGLRAILFGILVLAGFLILAMAAYKAGRVSPIARGIVLMIAALMGARLAWFVQGASTSTKFRTEAFSVVLLAALLIAVWAVSSTLFETRRHDNAASEKLSGLLAKLGLVAVGIGLITRLLFTTAEELEIGETNPANFRMSVLWFIGFAIFATWLLGSTKFGSWIFAVGGNKQAARQIGVPAARTKTQLFMIVSVAAWLVGLLLAFRLNTLQSGTGNGLEFEYIIAAVVGGTLLTGGYGSAFGAAIGALIMAMSKQGIPAARWNSDWRFAFLGVILLSAVIANNFIKNKAEAAGR